MPRYEAQCEADLASAWAMLAEPARWHEWAPHVGGGWGLGDAEVQPGARGGARLLGVVPVPAIVTRVVRGAGGGGARSWRVGRSSSTTR